MLKLLAIFSLVLVSCYALTDEEIALFFNDGCGGGSASMVRSGDSVVLTANGIPDHKWQLCNPNTVEPQNFVVTMPNEPTFADEPYCLGGGPIGWAINGVAIFNPFALGELNAVDGGAQETFDICDGHPTPGDNQYHYHRLPMSCIYQESSQEEQFVGVARDGFPIYGPYQADLGRDATNEDLDECHGRTAGDRYRYVFLSRGQENFPYVMGCYRAEPSAGGGGAGANAQPCGVCTNGQSPCYASGQVCTCIGGGGNVQVDLLSYEETTEEGDGNLTQCDDDPQSSTCRDPHDQTPDDLEIEVLKTLR